LVLAWLCGLSGGCHHLMQCCPTHSHARVGASASSGTTAGSAAHKLSHSLRCSTILLTVLHVASGLPQVLPWLNRLGDQKNRCGTSGDKAVSSRLSDPPPRVLRSCSQTGMLKQPQVLRSCPLTQTHCHPCQRLQGNSRTGNE
jgi:hypothetical protein